jgi:hypothetical protein
MIRHSFGATTGDSNTLMPSTRLCMNTRTTILVAECDAKTAKRLAGLLSEHGWKVIQAPTLFPPPLRCYGTARTR